MKTIARVSMIAIVLALPTSFVLARDDGRYANSPLKPWFDSLKSGRGLCCSNADGIAVSDPDWDSKDGHYRVRLEGEWIEVPDDAVITEPNRAGRTMVWPIQSALGKSVRCFLPGTMSWVLKTCEQAVVDQDAPLPPREHGPYVAVLVELPQAGGVRMVGNLLGDPMQVVTFGAEVCGVVEHPPESDPPFSLLQWRTTPSTSAAEL